MFQVGTISDNASPTAQAAYAAFLARSGVATDYQHRLPISDSSMTPIPLYDANGSPVYQRSMSSAQYPPQIDTKSGVYPQTWTIPGFEDTSPVDSFNVDQSAAYMSAPNNMPHNCTQGYRKMNANARPTWSVSYMGYDNVAAYAGNGLPFLQTSNLRAEATTEAPSPLNMTSIQSALPMAFPERPHQELTTRPRLPKPEPSPFQTSRNRVDQLQDQRLRSAHVMTGSGTDLIDAKPVFAWSSGDSASSLQDQSCSEVSSANAPSHSVLASPIKFDNSLDFEIDPALSAPGNDLNISSEQRQLNFNSSTMLEQVSLTTPSAAYSNFRNYALPISSSSDSLSVLARQSSQSDLRNFNLGNSEKRESFTDPSGQAAFEAGPRVSSLSQSLQPKHGNANGNRRVPNQPVHRQSMPTLNRGF